MAHAQTRLVTLYNGAEVSVTRMQSSLLASLRLMVRVLPGTGQICQSSSKIDGLSTEMIIASRWGKTCLLPIGVVHASGIIQAKQWQTGKYIVCSDTSWTCFL